MKTYCWHCLWLLFCIFEISAQKPVAPFDRQVLTSNYYAEGVAVGDFNRDGKADVVSGPFWWQGPTFTQRHSIYKGRSWPIGGYSDNFMSFASDVNGDGWQDVIVVGFPGTKVQWFENPKAIGKAWNAHVVASAVGSESPSVVQLVAGGAPELVGSGGKGLAQLGYWTPSPGGVTKPWVFHPIFTTGTALLFFHGLGVGDVNADGRNDVVTQFGWLEQPKSLVGDPAWRWHQYRFGGASAPGGSQMLVYDVDGDTDNDIVAGIDAHGYGLSWFENRWVNGAITFKEHVILPKTKGTLGSQFSQLHAIALSDVDGDGLRDIVTGKTFWAHNGRDPGAKDPAVLYWFKLSRPMGTVTFTQHRIDNNSGVGRQLNLADVDGDGRMDVVTSNKKGVFVFRQHQLWGDLAQLTWKQGGTQSLTLDVGVAQAGRQYWMVGSASGSSPGVRVAGLHLPLNLDSYTDLTIGNPNGPALKSFRGRLDAKGRAAASFNLPASLPFRQAMTLHHAFAVFDKSGQFLLASNAASLRLR